jgi:lysophospholipase L1-like esterase
MREIACVIFRAVKRFVRQVVIAVVGTLVLVEVCLQIASAVAAPLLRRSTGAGGDADTITILCVGDSHTYGAPLPERDAYPAQLQRVLDERFPRWKFEVLNLGFPGVNSTFVANRLEAQLMQIQPDVVMVSAGANNLWNKLEADSRQQGSTWRKIRQALLRIKLFRLMTIAFAVHEKEQYQGAEGGGQRWFPDEKRREMEFGKQLTAEVNRNVISEVTGKVDSEYIAGLDNDMSRIKSLTDAFDIPLIWFNYPWRNEAPVMDAIDQLGHRYDIAVVQGANDFERALADGNNFNDLFIWAMGAHPNALMYQYVVESMVPFVEAALLEARDIDLSVPRVQAADGA